jgi:hypothetical protein
MDLYGKMLKEFMHTQNESATTRSALSSKFAIEADACISGTRLQRM